VGWGKVECWSTKAAISLKRVKIDEKLLWRAYRNSPTLFRTAPSPTPYDLLLAASCSLRLGVCNPNPKLQSIKLPNLYTATEVYLASSFHDILMLSTLKAFYNVCALTKMPVASLFVFSILICILLFCRLWCHSWQICGNMQNDRSHQHHSAFSVLYFTSHILHFG